MATIVWCSGEAGNYDWVGERQKQTIVQYGHCDTGVRWFWYAGKLLDAASERFGYVGDEGDAIIASREAVKAIAGSDAACAVLSPDVAANKLKALRKAEQALKRKQAKRKPAPDLAALREAMLDAHPDRGGSSEKFVAARAAYVEAKTAAEKK
jgi:hypothetical protein